MALRDIVAAAFDRAVAGLRVERLTATGTRLDPSAPSRSLPKWRGSMDEVDQRGETKPCARAFRPGMVAGERGHIVSIALAAGVLSNPNISVHRACRWALIGWSDSMRLQRGRAAPASA